MFIYSLRARTLKFLGIVCVAMAALIALIVFIPSFSPEAAPTATSSDFNFSKIKTADDRVKFIEQFGWEVNATPVKEHEERIPDEFDDTLNSYNELQKLQGLDLTKYKGKKVQCYTYEVKNYPDYNGTVYVNLIIYKNNVIGADICSADVSGFIKGLGNK